MYFAFTSVCYNLFNGSDGKVIEQVPSLVSDALFTFVITFSCEDVRHKVTTGLLVTDVADTGHQFIADLTRIIGVGLQHCLYTTHTVHKY